MDATTETARYRRMIYRYGEAVTVRVWTGTGGSRTPTDCLVTAWVRGYKPEELTGQIVMGDMDITVMAPDLVDGSGNALVPKVDDYAVFRGHSTAVKKVDDNTIRIAGTLIAYRLTVRGF